MLSKNKFQNEDQMKTLSDVQKLRDFITHRSALCTKGKYYQCTKHNINTVSLTVHVLKDS